MATATSAAITHVRIDPLTGVEDWASWSVQMEDLLYGLKLWDFVRGVNKPKPKEEGKPTEIELKELDEWWKKDQSMLITIQMYVSTSLIQTLRWCTTSPEVWLCLEKNFKLKGILHMVQIQCKLLQAQYCELDNMEEFFWTMVGLCESLACMGHDLSDEEFSIMLLTVLLESWDPMISSINHTKDLTNYNEIVSHI